MGLDRKAAARTLKTIAALLEVNGDNPYRVRAFTNAARSLERVEGDLAAMVTTGEVMAVRGIGKGTAGVLAELVAGERPQVLRQLESQIPPGVRELLGVAELGPKRVRALWNDLGIQSPGELEYACLENRLVERPGFGATSQARILDAVRFVLRARERMLIHDAWAIADRVVAAIGSCAGVDRVEVTGELRRGCETVESVDLVAVADELSPVSDAVSSILEDVAKVNGAWVGVGPDGARCVVRWTRPQLAGAVLLWSTGAGVHRELLARRAAAGGLGLDQDGLRSGDEIVAAASEEEIYGRLGLAWVPTELREGGDEIERAARGALPELVTLADLGGALHNHTTDSDGAASLEEMARAAAERGWEYLGIADHSPVARYANGLDAVRLRAQWEKVDAWNAANPGLRLIKGLEADILPDGSLDVPEGCAAGLEYVVASVHSSFRLAEEVQTRRLVAAVRNPDCRVLGHPTGRLLLARPAYAVDLDRVLEACAEAGVVVEINANPHRLDLGWREARRALNLGLQVAINPDAHAVAGLDDVRWGVLVARKAGARREDVVTASGLVRLAASGAVGPVVQ